MFASNSHQVFRSLNNVNENTVLPLKNSNTMAHGTVTKTPAASNKQRRALGDISNRKQGGGGGGLFGPKKTPGRHLQPQQQQQQQRMPLSTKTPKLSKKKEVTFLPRPTQILQQPSSSVKIRFVLGTNNKSTNQRPVAPRSLSKSSTKAKTVVVNDPVEDIELPAGRLWEDQLNYDDDDSIGSLSLSECDLVDAYKKRHQLRVQRIRDEEAREDESYQNYLANQTFDDDENAILGGDVWIERTLSFDIDLEEELSFGAPSFCGDISF